MTWLNEIDKPKEASVYEVKYITTRSGGDGMILKTSTYDVFLWNSSVLAKQITQALIVFVESGEGFEIRICPDKKLKEGFKIKKGGSVHWFAYDNVYSTEEVNDSNPLL